MRSPRKAGDRRPPPPGRFPTTLAPFRDSVPPAGPSPWAGPAPASGSRIRSPWHARLAAAALVLSAPVAAWRVVGPNPGNEYRNDPLRDDDWDHLMHPPSWDPDLERVVGLGGVIVFVLAVAVLIAGRRRGHLDAVWVGPLLAATVVGLGVGAGQRVVTAAVVGANIGGGFVLLFGVPTAALLVGLALFRTIVILRTTDAVDVDAPMPR